MKFSLLIVVCLACGTFSIPLNDSTAITGNVRDVDLMTGTKELVLELIENLSAAAEQAKESIVTFKAGLEQQAILFEEKILGKFQSLRDRVDDSMQYIGDKFVGLGDGVRACIGANREKAEDMYKQTLEDIKGCGKKRVGEIDEMIKSLMTSTESASTYPRETLSKMKACYDPPSNLNVLSLGRCLGNIIVETELKAAGFLAQSGLLVGRINFSLATLPAGLEICAGTGLFQAGVKTGKIVTEIISCSASPFQNLVTVPGLNTTIINTQ